MIKLNLGAGYERLGADWITIDLDPSTNTTLCRDVRDLGNMPTNSVDEIRAVDILEHLSYRDIVPALREWCRVLKPGGWMFVQVPAADRMMEDFVGAAIVVPGSDPANLDRGLPDDLQKTPLMMRLAWRLLGGHFDQQYTRDSERWYLNAHHALFDEETLRWAAAKAGLLVESLVVNPHPNYQVWLVKL